MDQKEILAQLGGDGPMDGPDPELDSSADADLDEPLEDDPADDGPAGDDGADDEADEEKAKEEAEEAKRKAAEEEKELYGDVKFNGETVSKKSFLKRLKALKEKHQKELEERLSPYKTYDEKKDHYAHWDKNHKIYQQNAEFIDKMRPVLQQDPWLLQYLQTRMSGKAPNYAELVQQLKPFLAPFWDGVEMVEADPSEKAMQEVQILRQQLESLQQGQRQQAQQVQEQERVQVRHKEFAQQEAAVWKAYPEFKNKAYRDLILSKAESVQMSLEEGKVVNIEQVAHQVFGELRRQAKAEAEAKAKAREKAKRAGAEGPGRLPHTPAPIQAAAALDDRAKMRALVNQMVPGDITD